MLIITKDNICEYIKTHTDFFAPDARLTVREIGDAITADNGDGFVNFVFIVADENGKSCCLKQARDYMRRIDAPLTPKRNLLEYDIMRIRSSFCEEYVPKTYYLDAENFLHIVEDLSSYNILRFELCSGKMHKNLARNFGVFLARSHFFTSEYYLDEENYRILGVKFLNQEMRNIMNNAIFLLHSLGHERNMTPESRNMAEWYFEDERTQLEQLISRDVLVQKQNCLIHGDLHTSNIFVNDSGGMKVFDMEYTFLGPYSYDMGYFLANIVTQHTTWSMRSDKSPEEKRKFKSYLLELIKDSYNTYLEEFEHCFKQYAKPLYRNVPGFCERIHKDFLFEVLGFIAAPSATRLCGDAFFPDFDVIPKDEQDTAKRLSLVVSATILRKRYEFTKIEDLTDFLNSFLK